MDLTAKPFGTAIVQKLDGFDGKVLRHSENAKIGWICLAQLRVQTLEGFDGKVSWHS